MHPQATDRPAGPAALPAAALYFAREGKFLWRWLLTESALLIYPVETGGIVSSTLLFAPFYVLLVNKPEPPPPVLIQEGQREASLNGLGSLWSGQQNNPTFLQLSSLLVQATPSESLLHLE